MVVIFKALANANRLHILQTLYRANSALSVNDIAAHTNLPQPKVSDHLKLMRINKIVQAKQENAKMLYSIADGVVASFISQTE